jgi:hypothetical protein
MSLGECTANDFFISTLTSRRFSAIATLHQLETDSLLAITQNCRLLKHLVIDMLSESFHRFDHFFNISLPPLRPFKD